MNNTFLLISTLLFVAVILAIEGAYIWWNAAYGPEARRMAERIRRMSAGGHASTADHALLKQRMLAEQGTLLCVKSSVLRALSNEKSIFVEDRLFATLDPLTREIHLAENTNVLLTDTVGFIRKLPHNLVASFRATLEEVAEADLLLHVIDASHPGWEEQRSVVNSVLDELGANETPTLHVFNKVDLIPHDELIAMETRIQNLVPGSVFVSTVTAEGLDPLRRSLLSSARKRRPLTEIRLPLSDGKLLAEIHREAEVIEQRHEGEELVLIARLDDALVGKLRSAGAWVAAG